MRIISPVDQLSEVLPLLNAGATELYGGYVPSGWSDRFSLYASINQRTFDSAQIGSMEELTAILEQVHARDARFSLTLNAPFYTDAQIPALLDYIAEAVSIGVDGLILADLGLLRQIRKLYPQIELHASTLAHLANSEAVAVYVDAGIDRVVLPRHLPVAEMAAIIKRHPGVAFDAFLLIGNCPNTEGLCTFHHSSPDKIWPCEIPYTIEAVEADLSGALQGVIEQQMSWSRSNRRNGCGLCAIPALERGGVFGLKLVGRGASTAMKVKNVLLAAEFDRLALTGLMDDLFQKKAHAAHRDRFGQDCTVNLCYYPEFFNHAF
ncbi:MAG: U32 family peptidase [Desulfuromonadales bacterium]|nr:U32 family peptidase [Desulfuromonadales bacterium]